MAYSHIPASTPIIILATCINILFYLISGLGLTRNTFLPTAWPYTAPEMRPSLIIKTCSGFVFAFCYFAIGSNELFIHYFNTYTIIAVIALTVVMFFSMRLLEEEQPKMNRGILFRSAILSAALTFYFVVPLPNRLAWRFDNVYYREMLQFALENPEDEDAQRDLENYEQRMQGVVPFEPME